MEYLVISRQNGQAKTGPTAKLKVVSTEGNESMTIWNTPETGGPQPEDLFVPLVQIRDFNGTKSLDCREVKVVGKVKEGHPLYNKFPRPVTREEWMRCISALAGMGKDEQLKAVILEQAPLLYEPYSMYPAATTVHHAFKGGLLNHTHQMLHMLEGLFPSYPYPDDFKIERCILAILFHDWGKTQEYTPEGEPTKWMYLLGHIFMSAQYLNGVLTKAGVAQDEKRYIVHCVLAHHGELEYGSPVKPCIPEAQLVNYLDNISAKADVFSTTGNMEKSFALGTTVVK